MAMSGVTCSDKAVTAYTEQKKGKSTYHVIYKVSDDRKSIEIDEQGGSDWESFVEKLLPDQCRYATVDFAYNNKSKLIFVAWSPDSAKVRDKMLFAASKDALKKKLDGIACEIQGSERGDLLYTDVLEKVQKTDY